MRYVPSKSSTKAPLVSSIGFGLGALSSLPPPLPNFCMLLRGNSFRILAYYGNELSKEGVLRLSREPFEVGEYSSSF